jgi:hypothetical protein
LAADESRARPSATVGFRPLEGATRRGLTPERGGWLQVPAHWRRRMAILLIVSVLTGCSVATDTRTSAPVTGSHSAGPASSAQIGGPAASGSPSLSAPSVTRCGQLSALFPDPGKPMPRSASSAPKYACLTAGPSRDVIFRQHLTATAFFVTSRLGQYGLPSFDPGYRTGRGRRSSRPVPGSSSFRHEDRIDALDIPTVCRRARAGRSFV